MRTVLENPSTSLMSPRLQANASYAYKKYTRFVWLKINLRHFWVIFAHCVEKPQKILGGIVFATVYCCWHMTKVFAILFYATMPISFAKITKRLPQNLVCLKDWISLCKISLKLRRASVENDWTGKSTKFKSKNVSHQKLNKTSIANTSELDFYRQK